jgi:hypothetical protein
MNRRSTGSAENVDPRAQADGLYGCPTLALVFGFPGGLGRVATLYDLHLGSPCHQRGRLARRRLPREPGNLPDEFALVAPGQVRDRHK